MYFTPVLQQIKEAILIQPNLCYLTIQIVESITWPSLYSIVA